MVYINGKRFDDKPGSCGTCPFFHDGSSSMCHPDKGMCTLFEESHHSYINPPARCQKLFRAAFKFPDGMNLVITQ